MKVDVVEVGPRDGLQNHPEHIPTERKIELINVLGQAGLREIEVSSFVSPKWIPRLADAAEVFAGITRQPGVIYSALVPNLRGLERALACELDKVAVFIAVSETFNQKNINASIDEAYQRLAKVIPVARDAGLRVRGYMSTVFHCPYEGPVPVQNVVTMAQRLLDMGCSKVALGDTVGKATPEHTRELLEALLEKLPPQALALHFHDTYGGAANNVRVALELGVQRFDGSVGGIGGCPYAGPGAPGNLNTATLVRTIRESGHHSTVDLDVLAQAQELL